MCVWRLNLRRFAPAASPFAPLLRLFLFRPDPCIPFRGVLPRRSVVHPL